MAETFSIGTHVTALWGHRWYAGVVDDIIDGGRAYEIAWAHEETGCTLSRSWNALANESTV